MKKKAPEARDLLLLLSFIVRKQGTYEFWPDDEKYSWVPYRDVEREFGIPAADVRGYVEKLVDRVSLGPEDDPNNMLQYILEEDSFFAGFLYDYFPEPLIYQRLTAREAVALKVALKAWGSIAGEAAAGESAELIAEVDKLIHGRVSNAVVALDERIHVPLPGEMSGLVEALQRAAAEKKTVSFRYYDPAYGETSLREVDPYSVFFTDNRWYVLGWCRLHEDSRTFYVEGITDLEVQEAAFSPRSLGITTEDLIANPMKGAEASIKVRLRFYPPVAHWVEERAPEKSLRRRKDGSVVSTIKVRSVEGMKRALLGFGDKVEVIEPAELREGLLENARALLEEHYS